MSVVEVKTRIDVGEIERTVMIDLDDAKLFSTELLAKVLRDRGMFVDDEEPTADLSDFDTDDLLDELRDREAREGNFHDARRAFMSPSKRDLFWELEKALPPEFAGLAAYAASLTR